MTRRHRTPSFPRAKLAALLLSSAIAASACGDDPTPPSDDGGPPPADAGPLVDAGPSIDAAPGPDAGETLLPGTVQILRDERGVPHIVAADFEAAMYALGWVHAEDRLFQMSFRRFRMQGRLAEHFAIEDARTAADRAFNDRLVTDDRRARTMGFARSAARTVGSLSSEHRALVEAYAAGVNAQLAARPSLGTAFEEASIASVDPWTAADALLAWDSVTYVFGGPFGDIEREVGMLRDCASGACPAPGCGDTVIDEDAAWVPPPADGMWPPSDDGPMACRSGVGAMRAPVDVKASHGFVVAGDRLTGGRPVLFGEPQLVMEAPSTWYEVHVAVPTEGIDVRGVGFAGAPGLVIFVGANVSQTLTAGGGDLADLFELTPGAARGTYLVDGVEEPLVRVDEQILVRGGSPIDLAIDVSRYGPVVNDILTNPPAGRPLAMRLAEDVRADSHSVVAGLELMRADTLESYRDALRHWIGPTVSAMYAGVDADDGESHIAYHSLVGIPRRAPQTIGGADVTGRHPYDGSDSSQDWQGILDLDWNPHVVDPASGYLLNGNSLPVGSWYDDYVYSGIRGNGDTYRSLELRLRLRALLEPGGPVDADALHALHFDSRSEVIQLVTAALRQMRTSGAIPMDDARRVPRSRPEIATRALTALERWESEGGGVLDQRVVGSRLAARVQGRMITTSRVDAFACTWGAAEGGVTHFLRTFGDEPSVLGRDEQTMLLSAVEAAWADVLPQLGADVTAWTGANPVEPFTASYQRSFYCLRPGQGGGCSLSTDHERAMTIPRDYTHTISSPHGSSWPVTIDFANPDGARALLAPGVSEEPTSPRFFDTASFIEAKGVGDPESIPAAPRDLSSITVVEMLELVYEG